MPIVKIEVCRTWSPEQVSALIEAVYQAQLIALKLLNRPGFHGGRLV